MQLQKVDYKMAESTSNEHYPPSGHDEDFVEEVEEDFQCPICNLPLKEPVLTRCGHRYCKECIDELIGRQLSREESLTCPIDRQNLDPNRDIFPDKATERKILSLAIRCPSDGCEWNGELRSKEVHLGSCPYHQVVCTNKNCGKIVQRRHLKQHENNECLWRIIQCIHCFETHPECQMEDHVTRCRLFPLYCPNQCGRKIPRKMVSTHIKDKCRLTRISCPYAPMGCKEKVQRQEVRTHLDSATRVHLDLACVKLKNTEDELDKVKNQLRDIEDKFDKTVTLLNETMAASKKAMGLLELSRVKHTNVFLWRIDGFTEILKKARNEGKEIIYSDPFYTKTETDGFGYKLKVGIYPNGCGSGKNTHLSVLIMIMKGEYDAILRWPFKKKVMFTLIDQQDEPDKRENITTEFIGLNILSFTRPTTEENTGWGFHCFISHEKLKSHHYIVDDSLFLQVEIRSTSN